MKLGNERVEFLVNTSAACSILDSCKGELSKQSLSIVGATGGREVRPLFQPIKCRYGSQNFMHKFLYVPDCPMHLLGRHLLSKLNAQIMFEGNHICVQIPEEKALEEQYFLLQQGTAEENLKIPEEVLNAVNLLVWASEVPDQSKLAEPVKTELKPGAQPVRQKQYSIKLEARRGLEPVIENFMKYGLLRQCQYEYNTPIFPVKKPHSNEYHLVQNLRAINQIVQDVDTDQCFTVLDLKDESPTTGRKTQLCWTVLPQGFKNSPTIFGNQLTRELETWQRENEGRVNLLQYVDDIPLSSQKKTDCMQYMIDLLNFLGASGYRVSQKKARIMQNTSQRKARAKSTHLSLNCHPLRNAMHCEYLL
uniref:ribonuclease H n=1 Tax=Otus sunia TaxID=257818 RepID=A0A8C8AX31_9STRI